MEYRTLGRTGVRVSTYALGTMMFGADGNPDEKQCIDIIHAALDSGITMVDTADTYSHGQAEEIVGKALAGRRDDVVLATKVRLRAGDGPNEQGASRMWIMRQVEASLKRLRTDHIDLYQIHRPDLDTELEETLDVLTDLVRDGKIRYFGCSMFPAWYQAEARSISLRRGLKRFASETSPYSIFVRAIELDVLPAVKEYGMGLLAWSPLNGGWLSGKYRRDAAIPANSRCAGRGSVGRSLPDSANAIRCLASGQSAQARHDREIVDHRQRGWPVAVAHGVGVSTRPSRSHGGELRRTQSPAVQ
jgi:aryl-alcohol dehydrogenase-like predicted oxidoreductase